MLSQTITFDRFTAAVVAAFGATQAAAARITAAYITATVTPGNTAILLPAALPGSRYVVAAAAGNGLLQAQLFPAVGDEIYLREAGNQGVNEPIAIGADECFVLECAAGGKWYGHQIS